MAFEPNHVLRNWTVKGSELGEVVIRATSAQSAVEAYDARTRAAGLARGTVRMALRQGDSNWMRFR